MPNTVDFLGDAVPDELISAFWTYEQALINDNLSALDDAFVNDERALRGDTSGLLVGHAQISAFRGVRGGAPRRTVRSVQARQLGADHVALVSVNEPDAGGSGLVTQVWQRCADGRWRIAVAHVAGPPPATDPRIWHLIGHPLIPPTAPGPLNGETIAVKDLFAVAGFPVGAGNPTYLAEAAPAPTHAVAVQALLAAGAEIRGIARTDEFAYSIAGTNAHYGTPPNPRVPSRLPGGSSSGPAAAVAMGHASIGLGTDTAGSIRVPASYQGLWGLRTTHGSVSGDGLLPLAPSFDAIGWLTRTPELLAKAAEATRGPGRKADGEFILCPELLELVDPAVHDAFDAWLAASNLTPQEITGPTAPAETAPTDFASQGSAHTDSARVSPATADSAPRSSATAYFVRRDSTTANFVPGDTATADFASRSSAAAELGPSDSVTADLVPRDPATASPANQSSANQTDAGTYTSRSIFEAFRTVQAAEAWRTHGPWLRSHHHPADVLGPDVAARFAYAATVTAEQERAARTVLDTVRAQLDAALGDDDILLLPTTPTPAPLRTADAASLDAARTATITLTCLAAITGRPAVSAPLLEVDGAPVGVSLLGPRGSDVDLVARASALRPQQPHGLRGLPHSND